MAKASSSRQTKTTKSQHNFEQMRSTYLVPFLATFAGVAFGVLVSLGFMAPIIKSEVASATKGLGSQRVISVLPADSLTACTGGATGSGVHTASAMMPGGKGGGQESGGANSGGGTTINNQWIHSFVSGIFATDTGTNSNTGANSHNTVSFKNSVKTTVTNTNDINVTNNNSQSSESGDATSSYNTTGGSSTSGGAANTSNNTFSFNIQN